MTLICSSADVDRLIMEMRCEWGDDPDLRRVADAIPLEVLEQAYLAKLGALSSEAVPERARGARQKVAVLRCVLKAWLRNPEWRLGQLFVNTITLPLFNVEDGALARSFVKTQAMLDAEQKMHDHFSSTQPKESP